MSLDGVVHVGVLDPHPPLSNLHVPFEDLVAGPRRETRLRQVVLAAGRILVTGRSGAGKTSMVEHVLSGCDPQVAVVVLSVASERQDVAVDPRACLMHLHDTLLRHLEDDKVLRHREIEQLRLDSTASTVPTPRRLAWKAGAGWKPLQASIQPILRQDPRLRSAAEIAEALDDVFEIARRGGRTPVVVLDDTDAWTQPSRADERDVLVAGFFGQVLRTLVERPCGLVVAAHDQYFDLPAFREAQGLLGDGVLGVPRFSTPDQLLSLLRQRAERAGIGDSREWMGEGLAEPLFTFYSDGAGYNLRKVFSVLKAAATDALQRDHERIEREDLLVGMSEWEPRD